MDLLNICINFRPKTRSQVINFILIEVPQVLETIRSEFDANNVLIDDSIIQHLLKFIKSSKFLRFRIINLIKLTDFIIRNLLKSIIINSWLKLNGALPNLGSLSFQLELLLISLLCGHTQPFRVSYYQKFHLLCV